MTSILCRRLRAPAAMPAPTPSLLCSAVRSYAVDSGKVAKTGQKQKQKRDEDAGDPLPHFRPKPSTDSRLPDVSTMSYAELNRPHNPRGQKPSGELMKSIDLDLRRGHDMDDREALFMPGSDKYVECGSVLLVEQVSSRSSPRKQVFAGVLLAVRRRGIMSNFVLRSYVLGTGVEMTFPLFSPMVTRIKVLQRAKGFVAEGKENCYQIRDKPSIAPFSAGKIDEMVLRENEAERRRQKNN